MDIEMEKNRIAYAVIAIVAVSTLALGVLYVTWSVPDGGPPCVIGVELSEPEYVSGGFWKTEVVRTFGGCPSEWRDLDEMGVRLECGESTIFSTSTLRNGLVASGDSRHVFFEDNGKRGRVDVGDVFYLIGLYPGSGCEFSLMAHQGTVPVYIIEI
jgi:hypothetical protein